MAVIAAIIFASLVSASSRVIPESGTAVEASLRAGRSRDVKAPPGDAPPADGASLLAFRWPDLGGRKESPQSVGEFLLSVPGRYNHIAYDVEYHGIVQQIVTLPMRRPRVVNLVMATIKTWLADMLVQLTDIRGTPDRSIDWHRSAAFAVFGFLYIGLVQWALYVSVMTNICPNAITFSNEPMEAKLSNIPGQIDLVKQVMMDNFVFEVLIYFPVFYIIKELVASSSKEPVADGLRKYKSNFFSDNLASMVFWIPGDCFAFAAPIFLRLPIDHAVSFVWTMVLSYRRGSGAAAAASAKPA